MLLPHARAERDHADRSLRIRQRRGDEAADARRDNRLRAGQTFVKHRIDDEHGFSLLENFVDDPFGHEHMTGQMRQPACRSAPERTARRAQEDHALFRVQGGETAFEDQVKKRAE